MTVKEIADYIVALRELTDATGVHTTRTQSNILKNISDADLLAVAVELKHRDILSGVKNDNSR